MLRRQRQAVVASQPAWMTVDKYLLPILTRYSYLTNMEALVSYYEGASDHPKQLREKFGIEPGFRSI